MPCTVQAGTSLRLCNTQVSGQLGCCTHLLQYRAALAPAGTVASARPQSLAWCRHQRVTSARPDLCHSNRPCRQQACQAALQEEEGARSCWWLEQPALLTWPAEIPRPTRFRLCWLLGCGDRLSSLYLPASAMAGRAVQASWALAALRGAISGSEPALKLLCSPGACMQALVRQQDKTRQDDYSCPSQFRLTSCVPKQGSVHSNQAKQAVISGITAGPAPQRPYLHLAVPGTHHGCLCAPQSTAASREEPAVTRQLGMRPATNCTAALHD